jgi:hypothetical protein
MADINLSPYTAEQQALDRRRKLAEAMQQQAIAPIDMPTMPGVRVSPMQGFAKLLQSYIAGKNLRKADEEQKAYETSSQEDVARLLRNVGKTETVPGDIITPAQEARFEPPVPIPENLDRKQELVNLIAPDPTNAARAAIGYNLMRPEDRERITNLPSMTEGREIPAVAEERGPSRQVPYLSADLLDPNNPNAMKTGTGRMMLAQVLMQQRAQEQAAALRKQEAEQAIVKFGPEDTAGRIVNGVFKPIVTGVKQPKWEKSSTYDVNGREITGWVNTNAPDIPASFVKGAVKPEMTKAQQLDMAIKLFGTRVEAQRAIDEGRVPLTFDPAELDIKPLPPQGVALQTGVVYDTPKGRLRWNGNRFTSD